MGLGLAQQLLKLGHTVAIIDLDPLACRFAREKIGVMAFEGSAVSTTVLLEAGIKQANAVVAALRDDAVKLLPALIRSTKYSVGFLASRLSFHPSRSRRSCFIGLYSSHPKDYSIQQ